MREDILLKGRLELKPRRTCAKSQAMTADTLT